MTFGVPLPRGAVRDALSWRIALPDSGERPAQTRVLDRWGDGSVRWLLIDAQVDVAGRHARGTLLGERDTTQTAPGPAALARDSASGVVIDTGAVRLAVVTGGAFPFESATPAGDGFSSRPRWTLTGADGPALTVTVRSAAIIEAGPLRAQVAVEGQVDGPGTLGVLEVSGTLDCYAGSPVVRVSVRLRNPQQARHAGGFWDLGDPGSIFIKDAALEIAVDRPAGESRCSVDHGAEWRTCQLPLELYQDSSGGEYWQSTAHVNREHRVTTTFRGYRLRSGDGTTGGLRATPVFDQRRGEARLTLSVPEFWQNFPRAIEADDARVAVRFFPRQYSDVHELQGGEQKTHVCYVAFGPDTVTPEPLDWTRSRVVALADPDWCLRTGAILWLERDRDDRRSLVQSAVDGDDTFERKREVIDEYGWRHFGDVYGDHEAVGHTGPAPLVSHYNNQYDTLAGFLYQFLRNGDTRWWTMAAELAGHVIDIDIYHTAGDKWAYNNGLFWHTYHYGDADTSTHRTYPRAGAGRTFGGGPSPDHNYTTGLLLYYFLTGDGAARDAVQGLAQFVIDADDGSRTVFRYLSRAPTGYATASGSYRYHGPGRGPANSLNALVDGHHLTGEARFLQKAEQLIARVVHPEEDIGALELGDPENKWFYVMFLQSLGKYLAHKAERGQLDAAYAYGRAALLHYARWMEAHEYPYLEKPEKLEYPTETWAAQDIRKSDVFCLSALVATGEERARLLEKARWFFDYTTRTLAVMPTRTLARPVIVIMSSGLLHPWMTAHPNASLPVGPTLTVPARQRFVPQKQIAMVRARWLAGATAAAVVAGTIWVLATAGPWL